jgi:anthranilate synthase component 2
MRLIMIDNYDSFTYNLVQLFYEFGIQVTVHRHDAVGLDDIAAAAPDWICISPGPKDPAHAGISKAVVQRFGSSVPILGVCLGMQVINEVFGGRTLEAPVPVHGKRSRVTHDGRGIFSGLPSPFRVARYHSLCIEPRTPLILPLAHAEDGVIMGISHRDWPVWGVQFHPESFLTEFGLEIAENFLALNPHWRKSPSPITRAFTSTFPRNDPRVPLAFVDPGPCDHLSQGGGQAA